MACVLILCCRGLTSPVCPPEQLWDLRTNTEVRQYSGHTFDTVACAFIPSGYLPPGSAPMIATASKDCSIRIWHRDTGECLLTHTDVSVGDAFTSLAVLPPSAVAGSSEPPVVHLVGTTIRARVLVFAVKLDEHRLVTVAACESPDTMASAAGETHAS